MNNLLAQETIRKFNDDETSGIDYVNHPRPIDDKTSDIEMILTTKDKRVIGDTDFSYEAKTQSVITLNEIKKLNREITRQIAPEAVESLFNEHSLLVKKKFGEGISNQEEKRLILIRWELDRIEDAFHGENIDRFESFLEGYEKFAKDINEFADHIRNPHKPKGRKR